MRAALATQAPLSVLLLVRLIVAGLLTGGACSIIFVLAYGPKYLMRVAVCEATLVSWRERLRVQFERPAVLGLVASAVVMVGHGLICYGPVTGTIFFASVLLGLLPLYWLQRRIYKLSWQIIRQVRAKPEGEE